MKTSPRLGLTVLEDRTTPTAQMIVDLYPGPDSSSPEKIVSAGPNTYFLTNTGFTARDLWKTDGTAAGTVRLKEFTYPSWPVEPNYFTAVGDTLYFVAYDDVHGHELWKSDGTPSGTVMVKDLWPGVGVTSPSWGPTHLTDVNGTLFFVGNDSVRGPALWKSDGTAAGTVLVKDVHPGTSPASYLAPYSLTDLNGTLFFVSDDGVHGHELWKSDGTAVGTVMVKDIGPAIPEQPGTWMGGPAGLTAVGDTVYFTHVNSTFDRQLWKSDGTAAGTVPVKDMGLDLAYGTAVGDRLFFVQAAGWVPVAELWTSDGTAAGTLRLTPPGLTLISDVAAADGRVFFAATDADHGAELWTSDGTVAGTTLVKDIYPGTSSYTNPYGVTYTSPNNSYPGGLTAVNGTLSFSADDGANGRELWTSDGTAAGTVLSQDINPGAGSSGPGELTPANGALVFRASDGVHGAEPWLLQVGPPPPPPPTVIRISDATVTEGNTGTTAARFTVRLSAPSAEAVTVRFATSAATATAGSDFASATGTVTFAPGETTQTITITVLGDRVPEAAETFVVTLDAPTGATLADDRGVGTIADDEPRVSVSDVWRFEGKKGQTTLLTFIISLSAPYDRPVTVSFATADGTARTADKDYVAQAGTLTFQPGERAKTVTVRVTGDGRREADETFYLDLTGLSGHAAFDKSRGVGTIWNDD
jgi:ELWxxDGT repeat protein